MAYTDIDKPSDYFNTVTYTGNGSTQSITGVEFQPDLVWIKNRSSGTSLSHELANVVRGANKLLSTNVADAEESISTKITSFDSDGFGIGSSATVNGSGNSLVAWNWKAGGTAVSNTDGDITSSVSANTTSGFSIVSWTGNNSNTDTVGHGLGVAPKIVLYKNLSTEDWYYWTTQFNGSNQYLLLNAATSFTNNLSSYGSITSSTISNFGHLTSDNVICFCFAEKTGFSKFGTYTGNGSTDGTFVYTGFKPAFVIFKLYNNGSTGNWLIYDNKRNTYNEVDEELRVNRFSASQTQVAGDFTSNGFKLRQTHRSLNQAGSSYIYMAFAENPFVTSTGVPTTAR
jgi:hypothetical protein